MPDHYQNTTGLAKPELTEAQESAASLAELILMYFEANPYSAYTPATMWAILKMHRKRPPLLTSVRARMTELTTLSKLEKLSRKRRGPYGKPEHYWQLADPRDGQTNLF